MTPISTTDTASPAPSTAKAVVVIALVALFAYYNSLHGAYVLDDGRLLSDPNIDHPFRSSMAPRPVVAISFAINHRLDGFQPRGYHLFNLLVHVIGSLTLFDLVRRTLTLPKFAKRYSSWAGWLGLAAALIWLVHPLQTQSVTYIIQRCESMMGMFFLLSLWCFLRGATTEGRKIWWYVGSVAACALGAGCKELLLALPPLALIYDRTFLSGSWRQALRLRWALYVALSIPPIVGIVALVLTGFMTDPKGTVGFGVKVYTPTTYLLTQTTVILYYLQLAFWPVGLTIDYLDWPPARTLADCWPAAIAVSSMLLITLYGVIRGRAWGFLGAWFFLILAPTSSIIPLQDAVFEHRMYLPLAAIVVFVVAGIGGATLAIANRLGGRRTLGAILFGTTAGVVVTLAFMTVIRNEDYSSATVLYADNVKKRPNNARVRQNLAIHLFGEGRVAEAAEQIEAAKQIRIYLPNLQVEQVRILREMGKPGEAVDAAASYLAQDPGSEDLAYELGVSLLVDDRPGEALSYLRATMDRQPTNKFARAHLGIALMRLGQDEAANQEFQIVYRTDPNYATQMIRTSRRLALTPDAKPSNIRLVSWYAEAACRMKPEPTADYYDTLAIAQARAGNFTAAVESADRATQLARIQGDDYLASRIEIRAGLFKAGKVYLPE